MHRFALALQDDRLLSAPWRERMWEDRGGPTDALGWGHGWMLREREGVPTVGHNGGIDGFTSVFELTRDGGWVMVALSNFDSVDAAEVGEPALRMALTDAPIAPPKPLELLPFDPQLGATLAGHYVLLEEIAAKVREQLGDGIADAIRTATFTADSPYVLEPVGQGALELTLRADGRLVNDQARIEITVDETTGGEGAQRLLLKQSGLILIYERAAPR